VALDQRFIDSLIRKARGRRSENSRSPKSQRNTSRPSENRYVAANKQIHRIANRKNCVEQLENIMKRGEDLNHWLWIIENH
jgi:hypothetical protein